ncbi:glycosyltransferase [Bradyrhizobium elkanii]|uniref:glycosyltransferase n=1 Tax=Bradyrhizobium elkanii TaxID=29448 RepID=UPI0004287178|nr:glycosyltransferase [Bradyrhizobium elkanii]
MPKVLLVSGFTETEINSFREIQYSRVLAERGWDVEIRTSTESYIWKYNRSKLKSTFPSRNDDELKSKYGITISRSKPLLRLSDFVLLPISMAAIRSADVVHVIEFRQGLSVVYAALAKLFGKPVIYDHEQRGDRHYTWLHTLDSFFRRVLICIGSIFPDVVRHTVIANRDHFIRNSWSRKGKLMFAPLAADERVFFFSNELRAASRARLGLALDDKVVVISGKIDAVKRTEEAARAVRDAGYKLILVGRMSDDVRKMFSSYGTESVIQLPHSPPAEVNALYNAADAALFTTFSISYWEALSTGLQVIVPRTQFSEMALPDNQAILFGSEEMFLVPEEQYKPETDVYDLVKQALHHRPLQLQSRTTNGSFLWPARAEELLKLYQSLCANART